MLLEACFKCRAYTIAWPLNEKLMKAKQRLRPIRGDRYFWLKIVLIEIENSLGNEGKELNYYFKAYFSL